MSREVWTHTLSLHTPPAERIPFLLNRRIVLPPAQGRALRAVAVPILRGGSGLRAAPPTDTEYRPPGFEA